MKELQVINKSGQLLVDSRDVAEMIGKNHKDLLESIRGYVQYLTGGNFRSSDFFIESTYDDAKSEVRPCYLLTRKGCDMVANKMTGEKGVLFTAMYVTKFEEMERVLNKPSCIEDLIIMQAQSLKDMRLQLQEAQQQTAAVKEEVQSIKDIIVINPKAEWRRDTNRILNAIGNKLNDYENPKKEVYEALSSRGNCKIKIRVENLQGRALREGMAPSKANQLNILDVLENDPKLKQIYISIVKEMAIKYGVSIRESA